MFRRGILKMPSRWRGGGYVMGCVEGREVREGGDEAVDRTSIGEEVMMVEIAGEWE